MREAVTVSREEEGTKREDTIERERENGRGNEHRFQGENIALFRNRANGYCGPFTGRQAAVSLYLIGWRGGKKRRGWAGGLSIGERWNIPRLCAISVIQGGEMLDRRFFLPLFILLIPFFFPFFFYSGFCRRGWVNWSRCCGLLCLLEISSRFWIYEKCILSFVRKMVQICRLLLIFFYKEERDCKEGMFHYGGEFIIMNK